MIVAAITRKFLSHLCGEEEYYAGELGVVDFLSHLCGEEGPYSVCFRR